MSKKAKAAAKEKRLKQKRARKSSMRAMYESWAASGSNKKKKKNRSKGQSVVTLVKHAVADCGNLGCSSCNPQYSDPFQAKKGSVLYGRRWSRREQS